MTSNLGSMILLEDVKDDGAISEATRQAVMATLRQSFRPEFLNRLDEIVMFKPLTKDNIGGIITLLMNELNARLKDRDIKVDLTDGAKTFIIDEGYEPAYGARPLKRFLQKNVETLSARLILEGNVSEGDTILIDVADGKLVATTK